MLVLHEPRHAHRIARFRAGCGVGSFAGVMGLHIYTRGEDYCFFGRTSSVPRIESSFGNSRSR